MSDANPNPTGREPMTDLDRLRECADLMRQGKAVFCPEVLEAAHERLAALEQPGVGEAFLFGIINTTTGWRNEGFKSAADALWHVGELCRLQRAALAPAPVVGGGEATVVTDAMVDRARFAYANWHNPEKELTYNREPFRVALEAALIP